LADFRGGGRTPEVVWDLGKEMGWKRMKSFLREDRQARFMKIISRWKQTGWKIYRRYRHHPDAPGRRQNDTTMGLIEGLGKRKKNVGG